jgi:citrate lyase synthetase
MTLKYISVFLSLYHSTNAPYSYFIRHQCYITFVTTSFDITVFSKALKNTTNFVNTDCRRTALYHEVRTPDPI